MGNFTGAKDVAMNAQSVLVQKRKAKPIMSSFHAVFSGGMMLGALAVKLGWDLPFHLFLLSGLCLVLVEWANGQLLADTP
ncbi:MAG: hypothetical protein R3350_09105, partial [Saprospiraceae bacterium]|nr:hypothetical protein [Saprospiraceae bacterium]